MAPLYEYHNVFVLQLTDVRVSTGLSVGTFQTRVPAWLSSWVALVTLALLLGAVPEEKASPLADW